MICCSNEKFVTILKVFLAFVVVLSLVSVLTGTRSAFLSLLISGGVLYALIKRTDWVVQAIQFWAVLWILSGAILLLDMIFNQVDQRAKAVLTAVALPCVAVGLYYYQAAPKYLKFVEDEVNTPSESTPPNKTQVS